MSLTNVMQAGRLITDVTTIAERLKQARDELGLSQDDFAHLAGVSPGTIGPFLRPRTRGVREILHQSLTNVLTAVLTYVRIHPIDAPPTRG